VRVAAFSFGLALTVSCSQSLTDQCTRTDVSDTLLALTLYGVCDGELAAAVEGGGGGVHTPCLTLPAPCVWNVVECDRANTVSLSSNAVVHTVYTLE
jgi:hypothetical protein